MHRDRVVSLLLALLSLVSVGCERADQPPATAAASTAALPNSGSVASDHASGGAAAAGGIVQNSAQSPVTLPCARQARDVPGNKGTSWYMSCPAGCKDGAVWGTDIYTDDSTVCVAARHAGATGEQGGVLLVTWAPAQVTYLPSTRNGVTSAGYGGWARSFFVQSVDERGNPTSQAPKPMPEGSARLSCTMSSGVLRGAAGTRWGVTCPPGCTSGGLWGTDLYTGDSSVCLAAIHAGLLTSASGGEATVILDGPQPSFAGSERNGVTSSAYGKFDSSFRVARVTP